MKSNLLAHLDVSHDDQSDYVVQTSLRDVFLGKLNGRKTYIEELLHLLLIFVKSEKECDKKTGALFVNLWGHFMTEKGWFNGRGMHFLGRVFNDCFGARQSEALARVVTAMLNEIPDKKEAFKYLICYFIAGQIKRAGRSLNLGWFWFRDSREDAHRMEVRMENQLFDELSALKLPKALKQLFGPWLTDLLDLEELEESLWDANEERIEPSSWRKSSNLPYYLWLWGKATSEWKHDYWKRVVKLFL